MACLEFDGEITCYRTERLMLGAYAEMTRAVEPLPSGSSLAMAVAPCASSLRLYDGTGFAGQVLMLTTRQTCLNLASYGFDNRTSSYKVGACGVSMYASPNLGGSLHPGASAPNSSVSTMAAGWSNAISSVWIG
ncbi:MAG: hypothetical protein ABMA25_09730 [Ilumatobacteraceae bacterium]